MHQGGWPWYDCGSEQLSAASLGHSSCQKLTHGWLKLKACRWSSRSSSCLACWNSCLSLCIRSWLLGGGSLLEQSRTVSEAKADEFSQKAFDKEVPLELAGVTETFKICNNSHILFQSLLNIVHLAVMNCPFILHPDYFLDISSTESIPHGQLWLIHVAFRLQKNAGLLWSAIIKHRGKPSFTSNSLRAFERPVNRNQ